MNDYSQIIAMRLDKSFLSHFYGLSLQIIQKTFLVVKFMK